MSGCLSRKCGYCRDYFGEPLPSGSPPSGSKKLLHWSAKDVAQWIRAIELEEYVEGLDEAGIHGAFMVKIFPSFFIMILCQERPHHVPKHPCMPLFLEGGSDIGSYTTCCQTRLPAFSFCECHVI